MNTKMDAQARALGIPRGYTDAAGHKKRVPAQTRRTILSALGKTGTLEPSDHAPEKPRMIVPEGVACFVPDHLTTFPAWGVFCQLYELRSARNWGIGDFADLARLASIIGAQGGDFVGVNPLHALFLADPARNSPFAPSNRAFLNPLYIAVDEVPGHQPPAKSELEALRKTEKVDYPRVSRAKLTALRAAFDAGPFADDDSRDDHDRFYAMRGDPLYRHAEFEALSAHFAETGQGAGYADWPAPFRDPESREVRRFCDEHREDIEFYVWLQWLADRQLAQAQRAGRDAGMRVGLYVDLAVGEAPDGSAGWGGEVMMSGLHIGAPPDLFQSHGQNWGLAAPSPVALEARDFAPFRDMIRAQLDHAGALRIDHVMALWQMFLIPEGEDASKGGYLRYPLAELVRVLAEESHRARAVIVGEDLGSVPRGFRQMMSKARILSYRLLYFEQGDEGFIAPQKYPDAALACLSTHDLPTLADWWQGRDIELREAFGLVSPAVSAQHAKDRKTERANLVAALVADELLGEDEVDVTADDLPLPILRASHTYMARTACVMMAARLADLAGPQAPTNVPGTTDEWPNWCLRSPTSLEELTDQMAFREVCAVLRDSRPRPPAND